VAGANKSEKSNKSEKAASATTGAKTVSRARVPRHPRNPVAKAIQRPRTQQPVQHPGDPESPRAPVPRAPGALLVLFGAKGDLVKRLLLPALYNLTRDGLLGDDVDILGVDHNPNTDAAFRSQLKVFVKAQAVKKVKPAVHAATSKKLQRTHFDTAVWNDLAKRIHYLQGDFLAPDTYAQIQQRIDAHANGNAVFYLATAPRFFGDVVGQLAQNGLLAESGGAFRRIVIEKPFGSDLASAIALNQRILSSASEQQIYRIDHFLGKETVQNILVSRFANGLFETFWNNHYIDHIQITAAETVGVEERANFYDHTGALRDMVPNHLLQLVAMIAMEPPAAFGADALRAEKAKVIGAIRPQTAAEARANSVRAQYRAERLNGAPVPGYREEENVKRGSQTETYVALKLFIDNWRWMGVPFYLRTGKRMSVRDTEIAICFKPAPYAQFRDTAVDRMQPNYLTFQIQPDEGMWFDFQAKQPGPELRLSNIQMGFAYADYFSMTPSTGYETLIYDCLIGDQTLFQRADNIENGWRAVQPFLDAFAAADSPQVAHYAAGSEGPKEADALLERDGRSWHKLG